ncbi:hypothetical protein N2152v2_008076 [Parachlorella kessleri]
MSKRSADLVRYVRFLVQAGVVEQPVWLPAMERVPPPPVKTGRKPPTITFPEDRLLAAYYSKHPEAKLEPIAINSFEPSTPLRFVHRQMELMEGGVPRKQAFQQVEQEFTAQSQQSGTQQGGIIEQVQREEEGHLRRALREYNLRRGHKPES